AVYQRLDVIQGPFLADDGLAAQMALAARPVEDTGSDTRWRALIVRVAYPFRYGAGHHAPLSGLGLPISRASCAVVSTYFLRRSVCRFVYVLTTTGRRNARVMRRRRRVMLPSHQLECPQCRQ